MKTDFSGNFDEKHALALEAADDGASCQSNLVALGICLVSVFYGAKSIPEEFEDHLPEDAVSRAKKIAQSPAGANIFAQFGKKAENLQVLWPMFVMHALNEKVGLSHDGVDPKYNVKLLETVEEAEDQEYSVDILTKKIRVSEEFQDYAENYIEQVVKFLAENLGYKTNLLPSWFSDALELAQKDNVDVMRPMRSWLDPYMTRVMAAYYQCCDKDQADLLKADWH
jgi:hypothetical protein